MSESSPWEIIETYFAIEISATSNSLKLDETEENVVQRQIQQIEVDALHRHRTGQKIGDVIVAADRRMVSGSLLMRPGQGVGPVPASPLRGIAWAAFWTKSFGSA